MYINKECNLVLTDLYEYDFSSCYYNILKCINWDLSEIEETDKKKRNIQLGLLQQKNKDLSKFLLKKTEDLIDLYLIENNINQQSIIVRQRDGLILSQKMEKLNISLPIDFRTQIIKMIIDVKRTKFLFITHKNKVIVKGITKPLNCEFFDFFKNINFHNKYNTIDALEKLRHNILKSNKIEQFCFKISETEILIPLISEGLISMRKSSIKNIDITDINKMYTWENCIWPFVESIMAMIA